MSQHYFHHVSKKRNILSMVVAILVLIALFVAAKYDFFHTKPAFQGPGGEVSMTSWTMKSFQGSDLPDAIEVAASSYTLVFEDATFHGRICNSFRGTYEINGFTLRGNDIVATKIACEKPTSLIENAFFAAMRGGAQYMRLGNLLEVVDPQSRNHFIFTLDE